MPDEVREAQLRVDALGTAAQAAHHDAQAALEEAREAHAKEHEELITQLATLTATDEPGGGAGKAVPEPGVGVEGTVHTAVVGGQPFTINVQTRSLSAFSGKSIGGARDHSSRHVSERAPRRHRHSFSHHPALYLLFLSTGPNWVWTSD